MSPFDGVLRGIFEAKGLPVGTTLENKVTWRLHRFGILDQCQYRVGKYRLDYAWPAKLIALEADGPHHWQPDTAVKDVARDCYLRSRGWLVFRVDETNGTLEDQLAHVVAVVNSDQGHDWTTEFARGEARAAKAARMAQWAALDAAADQRIAELDQQIAELRAGGAP